METVKLARPGQPMPPTTRRMSRETASNRAYFLVNSTDPSVHCSRCIDGSAMWPARRLLPALPGKPEGGWPPYQL